MLILPVFGQVGPAGHGCPACPGTARDLHADLFGSLTYGRDVRHLAGLDLASRQLPQQRALPDASVDQQQPAPADNDRGGDRQRAGGRHRRQFTRNPRLGDRRTSHNRLPGRRALRGGSARVRDGASRSCRKRPFLGVQSSSPMRRIAFHPSRPNCLQAELADRDARVIEDLPGRPHSGRDCEDHQVRDVRDRFDQLEEAVGGGVRHLRTGRRHAGAPSGGCSSTRGLYSTSWMRPSKVRCSIISRATSG